ncbi:MAG: DNA repair protein RecO [Anaerolineaceae bacterium]|jgi:DNA repair protein RecO (recombination protein O)
MSKSRTLHVEAVVLRHSDWGEADRLLTLYTLQAGKLRAVAKGARRLRSRKAGHLEPFTRVTLLLARGRDLWIVTQAQTVAAYLALRDDLLRTGYAAYIVELLDRFTYEEGENLALYHLLHTTLERIDASPDVLLAVRYYELRLLDLLGFRPELFHCVLCRKAIRPVDQFFSASLGGAVCPNCVTLPAAAGARPVSMRALKYMRHLQRSSYPEAQRASIPEAVQSEIEALLQFYLAYHLERQLNTPAFLREVSRDVPPAND